MLAQNATNPLLRNLELNTRKVNAHPLSAVCFARCRKGVATRLFSHTDLSDCVNSGHALLHQYFNLPLLNDNFFGLLVATYGPPLS